MACPLSGERKRRNTQAYEEKRWETIALREKTYILRLLWNKKRTNGCKVFLISRAHDELLLMSGRRKRSNFQ